MTNERLKSVMGAIGNVTGSDAAHRQQLSQLQVRLTLLEENSNTLKEKLSKDFDLEKIKKDLSKLSTQQESLTPKSACL